MASTSSREVSGSEFTASVSSSSSQHQGTLVYRLRRPDSSSSSEFPISSNPQNILWAMRKKDFLVEGATLSLEGDRLPPSTLAIYTNSSWAMQQTYFASQTDFVFRTLHHTFTPNSECPLAPEVALERLQALYQSEKKYNPLERIFWDTHLDKEKMEFNVDEPHQGLTPLGEILSKEILTWGDLAPMVNLLIAAGANIESIPNNNVTLLRATASGHTLIVRRILSAGINIEETTTKKATPLYVAAGENHQEIVALLLDAGANTEAAADRGRTPLYIASLEGHYDVVKLLLAAGARTESARNCGATPLFIASQQGHYDVVELLLAGSANTESARNSGATPLFIASQQGHHDVVKLLLAAGARTESARNCGATPLLVASQEGHYNVVKLLLTASANTEAARNDEATPLYIASQKGHYDVVELLLAAGAKTETAYNSGATPLLVASQNGHYDVVELLLTAGANTETTCSNGAIPLHIASQNGHQSIVKLLRNWVETRALLPQASSTDKALAMIKLNQYLKKFSPIPAQKDASVETYLSIVEKQQFFDVDLELLIRCIHELDYYIDPARQIMIKNKDATIAQARDAEQQHRWMIIALTLAEKALKNPRSFYLMKNAIAFCMNGFMQLHADPSLLTVIETLRSRLFTAFKEVTPIGKTTVIINKREIPDYHIVATNMLHDDSRENLPIASGGVSPVLFLAIQNKRVREISIEGEISFAKGLLSYGAEMPEIASNALVSNAFIVLTQNIQAENAEFDQAMEKEKQRLEGKLFSFLAPADRKPLQEKIDAIALFLTTSTGDPAAPASSTELAKNSTVPLLKRLRDWVQEHQAAYAALLRPTFIHDTETATVFDKPFQSIVGQGYKKTYQTIFESNPQAAKAATSNPSAFFYHSEKENSDIVSANLNDLDLTTLPSTTEESAQEFYHRL